MKKFFPQGSIFSSEKYPYCENVENVCSRNRMSDHPPNNETYFFHNIWVSYPQGKIYIYLSKKYYFSMRA